LRPFARQVSRLNATFAEGRTALSDCGHIRLALHTDADAGVQQSVVHATAFLPPLEATEPEPPAPGDGQGVVMVTGFAPSVVSFKAFQSLRKRPVDISVSVTQTTSDAEPVVSVAMTWAGREVRQ
jgi:hypothetical protein